MHGDIYHTATSSYAYLEGHLFDFYAYNKNIMHGNDYLPLIYLIFAAWNLPLHLLGLTTIPIEPTHSTLLLSLPSSPIEMMWWKLLMVLFYLGSINTIYKIAKHINVNQSVKPSIISTLFASSPFVVFSVFIFTGYDVISVYFTLLGLYHYLKKDIKQFVLFFSLAISFKYFAAIIFFPLVLMIEKRPLHIIKLLVLGSLALIIQLAIYWKSPVFQEEIFNLLLQKIQGNAGNIKNMAREISAIFIYIFICAHLFFKRFDQLTEWQKYSIFVPLLSYALMFFGVIWHPQWVIITTPFVALGYLFIRNKRFMGILEIIGMFCFTWFVVNQWRLNVDVSMMNRSILKDVLPQVLLINADLMHRHNNLFRSLFNLYLFAPLIILFYEKLQFKKIRDTVLSQKLILSRLVIGISFFVIPSFVCLLMPKDLAMRIQPEAKLRLETFLNAEKTAF